MTRVRKRNQPTHEVSAQTTTGLACFVLFSLFFLFLWTPVAFCYGQGETIAPIQRTSGLQTSKKYFLDRIQAAQDESPFEMADQILTGPSQTQWTRYLRSLLRLPDWIDLGVAFRVRGEVLTNPFRKGQSGTDEQLPVRTRARVGLNFPPFRFLF